jgi:hypothetical protein
MSYLDTLRRNQRLLTSQDIVDRAAERDRQLSLLEFRRACERGLREANKIYERRNPQADIIAVWKLCLLGFSLVLLGAYAAIHFWK